MLRKPSPEGEHGGQKGNLHAAKKLLSWSTYGPAGWRCLSKAAKDMSSGEVQAVCRASVSTLGHCSGRWGQRRLNRSESGTMHSRGADSSNQPAPNEVVLDKVSVANQWQSNGWNGHPAAFSSGTFKSQAVILRDGMNRRPVRRP